MAKKKQAAPENEGNDIFSRARIQAFAPDDASIPAAEKVLKKGGFGKVEATADGKGWWVVCQGLTDVYQVSVRVDDGTLTCSCTCPSPKYPCKHALALLLYLHDHPEERAEPEAPKHAATDFEALLRAAFQNPDDDTARLVLADFLDENNEPDRAALIRVQIEKGLHKARSIRGRELAKEENALVKTLRGRIEPLPESVSAEFRRGFLHLTGNMGVYNEVGLLPERFTRLFREGWVEGVHAAGFTYDLPTEESAALFGLAAELDYSATPLAEDAVLAVVARTADVRSTGRLCRVKVHRGNQKAFDQYLAAERGQQSAGESPGQAERTYYGLTRQTLDLLIRAGRFRTARRLRLAGGIDDAGAEDLAAADMHALHGLVLHGWQIGERGTAALADSPALAKLTTLGVQDTPLDPAAVRALARGTAFADLTELLLDRARLTEDALAELTQATRFGKLESLYLDHNRLTPAAVGALLQSPNFPALKHVSLQGNPLEDRGVLALVLSARDRPSLRVLFRDLQIDRSAVAGGFRLRISQSRTFDEAVLVGLRGCEAAKRVVALSLAGRTATEKGLNALAAGFSPAAVRELVFENVKLKNEGVGWVVAAFKDYRPTTLGLPNAQSLASGIAALAASPILSAVKVLDLRANTVGKSGATALANSPHLGNLERLELTDWKTGTEERKILRAKFGKKVVL